MGFSYSLILSIHIIVGMAVIGLVLLQHGKGADMGAAFGSGASGSLFGASGSANFMSRLTAGLAAVFFVTSLSLAYLAMHKPGTAGSVMDTATLPATAPSATPATPPAASTPAPTDSRSNEIPK